MEIAREEDNSFYFNEENGEQEQEVDKENERTTQLLLTEILETEKLYEKDLHVLVQGFRESLLAANILQAQEINAVFANVREIYTTNENLYHLLKPCEDLIQSNTCSVSEVCSKVARIFVENSHSLKIYDQYVTNNPNAMQTVARLEKANPAFLAFVESKKQELNKLDIKDYLIKPFQRLTKYPLFFRELCKLNPDNADLLEALNAVEGVVQHVNAVKKKAENDVKMAELEETIEGLEENKVNVPNRTFVKEGKLTKYSKGFKTPIHLLLFNDVIMICTKSKKNVNKLQCTDCIPVSMCVVSPMDSGVKNSFQLLVLDTKEDFLLTCANDIEKDQWLKELDRTINLGRDKLSVEVGDKTIVHVAEKLKSFVQLQLHVMEAKFEQEVKRRKAVEAANEQLSAELKALQAKMEAVQERAKQERHVIVRGYQSDIRKLQNNFELLKKFVLIQGNPQAENLVQIEPPPAQVVPEEWLEQQISLFKGTSIHPPPSPPSRLHRPPLETHPSLGQLLQEPVTVSFHEVEPGHEEKAEEAPIETEEVQNQNEKKEEKSRREGKRASTLGKVPSRERIQTFLGNAKRGLTFSRKEESKSKDDPQGSWPPRNADNSVLLNEMERKPTLQLLNMLEFDNDDEEDEDQDETEMTKMTKRMSLKLWGNEDQTILMGYLTKQGGRVKTWKRRWFILQPSTILYYAKPTETKPKGVIPLTKECIVKVSEKKQFAFTITTSNRQYMIIGQDDEDVERWIQAISLCIMQKALQEGAMHKSSLF